MTPRSSAALIALTLTSTAALALADDLDPPSDPQELLARRAPCDAMAAARDWASAAACYGDLFKAHPDDPQSVHIAHLQIDALAQAGDLEALRALTGALLKHPTLGQDETLLRVNEAVEFKVCSQIDIDARASEMSKCFKDFHDRFPKSERADEAIFNAAFGAGRAGDADAALQLFERLVQAHPQSALVPNALMAIGAGHEARADLQAAAAAYERLAERFPTDERTEDALLNAIALRRKAGQPAEAVKAAESHLKRFGRSPRAPEVAFEIGLIWRDANQPRKAFDALDAFQKRYSNKAAPDALLAAMVLQGNLLEARGQHEEARERFERAVELANRRPDLTDSLRGREAAAEALFRIAQVEGQEAMALDLKVPLVSLEARLRERIRATTEARGRYERVIQARSPRWSVAAICATGDLIKALADDLRAAPLPKELDQEQGILYLQALEDSLEPMDTQATEAYRACVDKADELQLGDLPEVRAARLILTTVAP